MSETADPLPRPGTEPSELEPEGTDAMQTLKLAARPLLLVLVWMLVSVHTISELATVAPTLRATEVSPSGHIPRAQPPLPQARSASRRAP